jgi:MFS transporter, UMF1 family
MVRVRLGEQRLFDLRCHAKAAAGADGTITGWGMQPGAWFGYMVSLSVLLQVIILPIVGSITDRTGRKKPMLAATAFVGALATTMLFFLSVEAGNFIYGGILFVIANVAFGASVVVSNAFLPDLASSAERDKVSSFAWALGYLGGGLLLVVHLFYFQGVEASGGDVSLAVRIILSSVGIWWALFTLVPLKLLPERSTSPLPERQTAPSSFRQLWRTLRSLYAFPVTLTFLLAYVLYNDAVQTVVSMASVYGQEELGLGLDVLTKAVLLVQFVAVGGSLLFERIASYIGTKNAISLSLVGWAGVLIAAYAVISTEAHFYVLAGVIAIVLGGTQALSRSLFSQMIPAGKEAEFFSLYEISDKGTSWLGPLAFALTLDLTGSYRLAVLSLIIFILLGLVVLMFQQPSPKQIRRGIDVIAVSLWLFYVNASRTSDAAEVHCPSQQTTPLA